MESLRRAIQKSALAVGLLHLPRRRYLEMSDRARALLGMQGTDLEYVDALTMSTEPDATYRVYTLILDGVLDGCRARRKLRVGDREIDAHLGVRVVARASRPSPPSQSQRRTARPEAIAIV
ncbi:MAG: hypothetical protein JOZ99_02795, partial [Actinobacteria bacterium]|nr:hypothetical protein [Actinomycetota bacterium]